MGPLGTVIFLLLLSGTTMSTTPEESLFSPCDSLIYEDTTVTNPMVGYQSFKNEAFFNNKRVYKYNSGTEKARPEPQWKGVENWNQISQDQKERGIFALKNVEQIRNASGDRGIYIFKGIFGCQVCDDNAVRVAWIQSGNGRKLVRFNTTTEVWDVLNPQGEMLKKNWEADPTAPGRVMSYLKEDCTEKLHKYKNYRNTN
ncbi:zinc-alpha-2-glycoprotein-like [Gracilinanus agilis]|uniref:zinc-alpha-2-glycoprotein-like n=1 Tax=Gracilinanus agilis TaxID=191870 RepID=UPI001CFC9BF1|nr:zinc-alpha-2-glycoprotein-like [Gracilinanus agilis]